MAESDSKIPEFEQALADLEGLVERMEQGDLTLEQSLEHFERGMGLSRACQAALDEARLKVDKLLETGDGDETEPFDDA
ncbi:MAG: exodeoxyribonuclease VII small subunit [Pseudomonadota bacterium]